MDPRRFDALTRSLAAPKTRRGLLGSLGALAAGLATGRAASAVPAGKVGVCHRTGNGSYHYLTVAPSAVPAHTAHGDLVGVDLQTDRTNCGACGVACDTATQTCAAGACVERCAGVDCSAQTTECAVGVCDPATGTCSARPANIGNACGNDGLVCTTQTCQADGTCGPPTPVDCPVPADECLFANGCQEPGGCVVIPLDEGACTTTDGAAGTCQSGACVATPTGCAGDGDCAGGAFCREGQCVGDLALGATCTFNGQCLSGSCTNGVCCNVAACGTCQACNGQGSCAPVAEGGLCTPANACFVEGRCTAAGACIAVGAPRACEPRACEVGVCENGACQYRPVEGEPSCGEAGECFAMVCRGGSCQAVGTNENQGCRGGTVCNPNVCLGGICQSAPERANGSPCPGGLCYGGACCLGATAEVGFCGIGLGTCCASERCCGGLCCDECFNEPSGTGGPDLQICCPAESLCPPNDPDAAGCCYGNETCIQTSATGYQCIDDDRVCGGVLCDGECCGTDCCEDGQYCAAQGCVAVPSTACTTDAQCGADLRCVGIIEEIDFRNGEIIVTPGFCCPPNRACPNLGYQGPGTGPQVVCLSYGLRCDSTGATCTNAYYAACGNCVNCSPRGGRTRL